MHKTNNDSQISPGNWSVVLNRYRLNSFEQPKAISKSFTSIDDPNASVFFRRGELLKKCLDIKISVFEVSLLLWFKARDQPNILNIPIVQIRLLFFCRQSNAEIDLIYKNFIDLYSLKIKSITMLNFKDYLLSSEIISKTKQVFSSDGCAKYTKILDLIKYFEKIIINK